MDFSTCAARLKLATTWCSKRDPWSSYRAWATGKNANALELSVEELEERIAPAKLMRS